MRSGRGRLFRRWVPRSRRPNSSSRASWTIAAVDAERSTCPPWPASLIRAPRMTSSPVYPSVVRIGSPVWIPMRTRTTPPGGHDAVARARWSCTAAATAWVARRNTTKNESPWVSTSQPSYAVKAARSRVRWVSSTAGYCSRRDRARAVLFSLSVWSTARLPLGSSDMDTLLCGRFVLGPLLHHLCATLPSPCVEAYALLDRLLCLHNTIWTGVAVVPHAA